jgi:hypothetical protein
MKNICNIIDNLFHGPSILPHNLGIYLKCMKIIEKLHGTCDCAGSVFLLTKEA